LAEAARSAAVTHNHPEGIKGAQATALAVFLARTGADKTGIRSEIEGRFGYDLARSLDAMRPTYRFDVSCQGSVPESLIAFLESADYEGAVRNAISLGGDADTMACIAGGIAEAFYGAVPEPIAREVRSRLPANFLDVLARFESPHAPVTANPGMAQRARRGTSC
jgi:ADP-ribosylglycohydrolase